MSRRHVKKITKKRASRWPLAIILAGIVLAAGAFLLAGIGSDGDYTAKVKGAPAIEVDQQEFDYGEVKLGSVITTSVRVTNVGEKPLRFTSRPYVELIDGC